jgi:hypothetical protein
MPSPALEMWCREGGTADTFRANNHHELQPLDIAPGWGFGEAGGAQLGGMDMPSPALEMWCREGGTADTFQANNHHELQPLDIAPARLSRTPLAACKPK